MGSFYISLRYRKIYFFSSNLLSSVLLIFVYCTWAASNFLLGGTFKGNITMPQGIRRNMIITQLNIAAFLAGNQNNH